MATQKFQKTIYSTLIASESIHIFCCGLPTLFSILSVLAGFGIIAGMPGFIDHIHTVIHSYELPVIAMSGFILFIGWGLYIYSKKLDCHSETSCAHGPCEPKKDRTRMFLFAATILFVGNAFVYMIFHRGMDAHFHDGKSHDIVQYHEHTH
tara:strand:- start:73 stop:525 length:453 start_codon:yes stop_codon:yes gene_type:complete